MPFTKSCNKTSTFPMNGICFFDVVFVPATKKVAILDVSRLGFGYIGNMNVLTSIAAKHKASSLDDVISIPGKGFKNGWFNIDILVGLNLIAITHLLELFNSHRQDTFSLVLGAC